MGKWMDLAAELAAASDIGDNRDDRDNSRPNLPNVPNVPPMLPASVVAGLALLNGMAAPKLRNARAWPEVVRDAQRLVDKGWAATALALGWTELDLFGAISARDGDPDGDGLAVCLRVGTCWRCAQPSPRSGTVTADLITIGANGPGPGCFGNWGDDLATEQ